ncbi:ATP-dependent helicase [Schinkia azotoformans]|uniref:ATP-dependent helicase n=1 Tax=Schinkia azotoformans TaxID=1454 RepID=UPI002DBC35AA|nr:ATP-dependent helicase [Schinkia azotoformans]MEC1698137.1 ATP-dependent helicase [Schinkia azotoformans]
MVDNDEFRKNIASSPLSESIMVQAGPGSGKTTLLIERLKYIIKNRNNSLSGIACITYTNAAKDEILMRLQNEGVHLPNELFIGTIHSFLLENIIKPYSYFFSKERIPFKLASFGFSRAYKREISNMLDRPIHLIDESIFKAFESLGYDENGKPCCYGNKISVEISLRWKKLIFSKGYIDQQDIIFLSYFIINKYVHIRKAISFRFPYILVDEYQDVTFYQEKLFSLLTYSSFFCVGDINQSIYSFTGAKPELFKTKSENEKYKSFTLSNNFRSTKHIVLFANYKTEIVQVEAGKNATSEQKVIFIKNVEKESEAIQIFQSIQKQIKYEEKYKPYMILARRNDFIKEISHFIKNQDLQINPFLLKLKKENYRCFQILHNFLIAISLKRSNQFEKAVDKTGEALSYLIFNEHPNFASLAEIGYNNFMWRKLQIYTLQFLDGSVLTETSVPELFLKTKEFLAEQSKNLYGKNIGTKIRMLNYKWKNQKIIANNTMLSHLIEQVELQENLYKNEGYVYNIHGAKGQEAESVLVLAQSEDQLMEWLGNNENSEEARVGYVAFSRARKLLCVWAPSINEENYSYLKQHIEFVDSSYIPNTEIATR